MLRSFINANIVVSLFIENLITENKDGKVLLRDFVDALKPEDHVADVGGGKKPAVSLLQHDGLDVARYDGFDLDLTELKQAKALYTAIFALDLTQPADEFAGKYDKIVCVSTLEHVTDTRKAMATLSLMLKPGGRLYVKIPNGHAVFATVNKMMPNETKRRIMHYVFPEKAGDGFPAYYDNCVPSKIQEIAKENGLAPVAQRRIYRSSYFYFFVPFYLVWRLVTAFQRVLDSDYCESVELEFKKKG